jgi:Spy/CpxP family protein refolding chaperone
MKKINLLTLLFTFLLMFLTISVADAQEQVPPDNQNPNPNQTIRPFKIFEELGLSPEQIQQIKGINKQRKPITQAAQQRWREANRSLDAAVYSDSTTDDEVKTRLKEAQIAQAELLKERTTTEYLIRKVLTPDQLIKFRQLREELMQRMNELKNRNNPNNPNNPNVQQQRPINRLQQRRIQKRQQQTIN